MLSFPVVFASSCDMLGAGKWSQSDQNSEKKGSLNLYREKKNRISRLFVESPDFFCLWISRWVGRSGILNSWLFLAGEHASPGKLNSTLGRNKTDQGFFKKPAGAREVKIPPWRAKYPTRSGLTRSVTAGVYTDRKQNLGKTSFPHTFHRHFPQYHA
jgi:hypothetical protein